MWCNLSLTLREIPDAGLDTCSDAVAGLQALVCAPWNYIQKQVTREGPSTALQGRKVTAAARRCPATSHSQAPSPMNPRPPTDTNGYRNYESVLLLDHPYVSATEVKACTNSPFHQESNPSKGIKKTRLHSLKNGEGEIRSSPVVNAPPRPSSPLRNELHSS